MKKTGITLIVIALLALGYYMGPEPEIPVYTQNMPVLPLELNEMEPYVNTREAKVYLRDENNAKIVWANDTPAVTEYVFLYLHGFSASRMEGDPVHRNIAQKFNSNLYLARLTGHGLKHNQLGNFTAENIWKSALEELAIAEKLGKKVIIISTSTGGTLALKMAADFPDKVYALINLSPNIKIKNPAAGLLNEPWGLQIARLVYGGESRTIKHKQPEAPQYWDTIYPAEATVQLEELLETTMLESTFEKVKCPVLNLYYYKDEENQDQVVDVSVIPEMHEQLGTPIDKKRIKALETPGDHVIASHVKSKDYQAVQDEIEKFCVEVLGINQGMK